MDRGEDYYYEMFRQKAHIEGIAIQIVNHVLGQSLKDRKVLAKEVSELIINGDNEW